MSRSYFPLFAGFLIGFIGVRLVGLMGVILLCVGALIGLFVSGRR